MSSNIEKVKPPKPGDLIRLQDYSAREVLNKLVRPIIFRLDNHALENITNDVYHHQVVAHESYITLTPGSTAMVLHFFDKPQYVKYITPPESGTMVTKVTNKFIKTSQTKQVNAIIPKELKGYIAYILYDSCLWSTDVFSSLEEFLSSYEIVDCSS